MLRTVRLCLFLSVFILIQVIASPYSFASGASIPLSDALLDRALAEPRSIQSNSPLVHSRDVEDVNILTEIKRSAAATLLKKRFWLDYDFAMKGKHTSERKRPTKPVPHGPNDDNTGGQKRAVDEE